MKSHQHHQKQKATSRINQFQCYSILAKPETGCRTRCVRIGHDSILHTVSLPILRNNRNKRGSASYYKHITFDLPDKSVCECCFSCDCQPATIMSRIVQYQFCATICAGCGLGIRFDITSTSHIGTWSPPRRWWRRV